MMKRVLAWLLALMLILAALPAAMAEEAAAPAEGAENAEAAGDDEEAAGELTEQQLAEIEDLDKIDDDEPVYVSGPVYHEMDRSEVNNNTPVLYRARVKDNSSLYTERNVESAKVTRINNGRTVDVYSITPNWCVAGYDGKIGYIKRERFMDRDVEAVDPVNTPPYGVLKSSYLATTATQAHVRKSMTDQDDSWVVLNPGTRLSLWKIQDGWGIVIYMRNYGYIDMRELTDLIPVAPTDAAIRADMPIAAFTSFYKMTDTETNHSRIINISVACERLTRVMQPGDDLNFNKQVGPYRKTLGYQPAPVLSNGKTTIGYGGGTCQVSSTLYNALKQLPGITILQRRPHGPSGASYLPHGMDAAVGNDSLNLRFRNDYPFPIRVVGESKGDGALLMIVYRADGEAVAASN